MVARLEKEYSKKSIAKFNEWCYNDFYPKQIALDRKRDSMRSKSVELMNKIKEFSENFYISEGRSPSTTEIGVGVGVSRGTAYRYLVEMAEKKMIEYDGSCIYTDATRKFKGTGTNAAILDCSVSCGPGQFEEEHITEYVKLPQTVFGSGEMYLLKASGDSMVDAGIDDGDWVVIEKKNNANEGDIVVALSEGLNNLKYFYKDEKKGCVILRSANKEKNYKDIEVYDFKIQGVARKVIKGI